MLNFSLAYALLSFAMHKLNFLRYRTTGTVWEKFNSNVVAKGKYLFSDLKGRILR